MRARFDTSNYRERWSGGIEVRARQGTFGTDFFRLAKVQLATCNELHLCKLWGRQRAKVVFVSREPGSIEVDDGAG